VFRLTQAEDFLRIVSQKCLYGFLILDLGCFGRKVMGEIRALDDERLRIGNLGSEKIPERCCILFFCIAPDENRNYARLRPEKLGKREYAADAMLDRKNGIVSSHLRELEKFLKYFWRTLRCFDRGLQLLVGDGEERLSVTVVIRGNEVNEPDILRCELFQRSGDDIRCQQMMWHHDSPHALLRSDLLEIFALG